jgi:hypothetical protein
VILDIAMPQITIYSSRLLAATAEFGRYLKE